MNSYRLAITFDSKRMSLRIPMFSMASHAPHTN
nr:MAG TPA: hypothetical protein [Caudoviricetes sp.]